MFCEIKSRIGFAEEVGAVGEVGHIDVNMRFGMGAG